MIEVDFNSLVGEQTLSGVDRDSEQHEIYGYNQECSVLRFCIGGINYVAIENPDDGYRSCMKGLYTTTKPIVNSFSGCPVVGRTLNSNQDILQFIDRRNGKVVLEVGTDNTDDYYPWFVDKFYPENMSINDGK